MAEKAPTVKELSDNILASFELKYGQEVPILKKAFLRVVSKVLGALGVIFYKYAGFLGLQMFISTASSSEIEVNGKKLVPLEEIGRQLGVGDPKAAVAAKLLIEITVTNQVDFIPAGTPLIGSINGVTYITEGSTLLDAPIVYGFIVAIADQSGGDGTGTIGNLDDGSEVLFINTQANVEQITIVDSTLQQGVDGEDVDTIYRQRVDNRRKNPPQGGALADYVIWGTEVNGIINIYPYTGDPGNVDVYAEATPESSGSPDGIPTEAQLNEVAASIAQEADTGLAGRSPADTKVNVFGISRLAFDVKVFELSVEDIGTVRAEIEQALTEYFLSLAPFITGITVLPRKDIITASAVGGVIEDVVSAAGGTFTASQVLLNGLPIISYFLGKGVKAKLGEVIFL